MKHSIIIGHNFRVVLPGKMPKLQFQSCNLQLYKIGHIANRIYSCNGAIQDLLEEVPN